jgi:hypothetical protein
LLIPRWLRVTGGLYLSLVVLVGLPIIVARAPNDSNACLVATDSLHVTHTLDANTGRVFTFDPIPPDLKVAFRNDSWQSPTGTLYTNYVSPYDQQSYIASVYIKTRQVWKAELTGHIMTIYGWSADSHYLAASEMDNNGQTTISIFTEPDMRRVLLKPSGIPSYLVTGLGGLKWSPVGHQFTYIVASNNATYLVIVNADTGAYQAIPTSLKPDSAVLWSPDSHYVVFFDDMTLMIYDLKTQSMQTVTRFAKLWQNSTPLVGWLDHTLYYLDHPNNDRIMAFDADNGTTRALLDHGVFPFAFFAPDMRHAIVEQDMPDESPTVFTIDFRQGTITEIIKGKTPVEVSWYDNGDSAILRFRDSFLWMKADGSKQYQVDYQIGSQRTPDHLVVGKDKVAFRTDQHLVLRIGVLDLNTGEVKLFKRSFVLPFRMSLSPDSKWLTLFFPIVEDHAGVQLTVLKTDDTQSWDFPDGSGIDGKSMWSADSSRVGFYTDGIGARSALRVFGQDGKLIRKFDALPDRFFPQAWTACSG